MRRRQRRPGAFVAPILRGLPAAILLLAAGCTIEQEQAVLDDQDVRLTVLHTADIHSRLLPYDLEPLSTDVSLGLSPLAAPFGGVARVAAVLERERARSQRVLHYDSGDIFQGAPIFNEEHGEVEFKWLTMMRPNAVAIGNHEYDEGASNLFEQMRRYGQFPFLAANYKFRDPANPSVLPMAEFVAPYTIDNVKGLRVAAIGMGSISSLTSIVSEGNNLFVTPLEQNEVLRSLIEFLLPQVDVIAIVSHLGLSEDTYLVSGYERTYRKDQVQHLVGRQHDPWRMVEDYEPGNPEGLARFHIPGVRGIDFITGGHLHVVLNPPQVLTDLDGRGVILAHSGAFAKYLGRLDMVLHKDPEFPQYGYEVKTHSYEIFPMDAAWCKEERRPYENTEEYKAWVEAAAAECASREHAETLRLLEPYIIGLNQALDLPRIFAWAPMMIPRRNTSTGGDAPLGNLTAEAIRTRRGVEAEICITNTLGIRDAIYAGPVNLESMFNVFPFENYVTLMYLSGSEIQEALDFVTRRSSDRGCQSQIQISGLSFTMDCGQVRANDHRYPCSVPADCPNYSEDGEDGIAWQCRSNLCYAHPAKNILVHGQPLDEMWSYRVATNDYLARGGSGFKVFARNTTQVDTAVSIRDALIDSMRNFCNCEEILDQAPGSLSGDEVFYCNGQPTDLRSVRACETINSHPDQANAGRCLCRDVLAAVEEGDHEGPCGRITPAMEDFCNDPMRVPVLMGYEDGRIERRVVDRSLEGS